MNANKEMIAHLAGSEVFQDYARAYSTATGMPLAFRPLETFDLPFQGKLQENAFCAMMARKNRSCAACLQMQDKLRQNSLEKATTAICVHGLCEAAVPVRLGDKVIGFLQTGQVLAEKPTPAQIERVVANARKLGAEQTPEALRTAYLKTPIVSREKFRSTLHLLSSFAELLSMKSNQVAVAQANTEPPVITRAKKIIQEAFPGPGGAGGPCEFILSVQTFPQDHRNDFHGVRLQNADGDGQKSVAQSKLAGQRDCL